MLLRVYSCQDSALFEITCCGSRKLIPTISGQISVNPTVSPQLFLTQAPPMFLVSQIRPSSQGSLPQSEQVVLTQSAAGCKGAECLGSNTKGECKQNENCEDIQVAIKIKSWFI